MDETLAVANEYNALSNYLYVHNLPADVKPTIVACYMDSLHVFIIPLVASGFGVISALLTKKAKFQKPSITEDTADAKTNNIA